MAGASILLNPSVTNGGSLATRPWRAVLVVSNAAVANQYPKQGLALPDGLIVGTTTQMVITHHVTSASWGTSAEENYINLRLSLNNFNGVFNRVPIGSKVQIQMRSPFYPALRGGAVVEKNEKWLPYLTVYLSDKTRGADGAARTMEWTLYDRLQNLTSFPVHGKYVSDKKKRKKGWTATEIIRHLCKAHGVPVGVIPTTKFKIPRFEKKLSFLAFIRAVLAEDKKGSKRKTRFIIDMLDDKLNIRPETGVVPKNVYYLDEEVMLESGSLKESQSEKFATRVIVTAQQSFYAKNSRGARVKRVKRVRVVLNASKALQTQYGIRPKAYKLSGLHTAAAVKRRAAGLLEEAVVPVQEFSVTCRGVPGMWPGTKVFIRSEYFGINGLLKVTSVQYETTDSGLSMTLGLQTDRKTVLTEQQTKALKLSVPVRY